MNVVGLGAAVSRARALHRGRRRADLRGRRRARTRRVGFRATVSDRRSWCSRASRSRSRRSRSIASQSGTSIRRAVAGGAAQEPSAGVAARVVVRAVSRRRRRRSGPVPAARGSVRVVRAGRDRPCGGCGATRTVHFPQRLGARARHRRGRVRRHRDRPARRRGPQRSAERGRARRLPRARVHGGAGVATRGRAPESRATHRSGRRARPASSSSPPADAPRAGYAGRQASTYCRPMPTPLPITDRPVRVAVVGLGQIAELCLPPYLDARRRRGRRPVRSRPGADRSVARRVPRARRRPPISTTLLRSTPT